MSWFSGGSSSGGWFGGKVSEEQRQDDQPLAKMAAKPTAVRDWEQQTIAAERLALAGSHEGPARPKWNPFLSLENSEKFDNKMKNMRQMKDQAPAGDIVLRSFEQQVLGAPLDGPAVPAAGSHGHGGENQEVEGVGKGIDGHVIPLMLPWVTWPPQRTRWTPAPDKDDMGHARMSPDQERRCMGLAYYHQGKTYEYYEVACQIEFARNDELSGHLAGCAGLCFHLRHKNSGVASYLYYVRLGSDETAGDELVLARLEASSYDQYDLLPTEIEVLNKYHRGKFLVNDGVHYFRVRSFSGGFMFYFNHAYVGFHEVKEQDKTMATFGHCGIWTYDLEVSVKKMLQKNLEDMEMLDTGTGEELETGFQGVYALLKAQHLVVKSDRMIMQDVFIVWCKLLADIREARMAPFRHLEGAEKAHAQKQMLAEWLSTLYTLQRYAELLTSSDHLKGRRLQLFLNELDHTNPPPPPPPLAAPPTPEDEELHYLYEMQQRKYQKQIEDAGRKVLGKEKFAELKNMTTGSLAQQQKGLVAQKQRQMAAESVEESQYQALTKMAQRLLSNFGEMEDLVPKMKSLRGDVSSAISP